jgi:hypothetical protein
MFYQKGSQDPESAIVKIEDILSGITDIANRAYEGAAPADRLAFEVGMLHSKLREMSYLLANAVEHIKELEIELAYERK